MKSRKRPSFLPSAGTTSTAGIQRFRAGLVPGALPEGAIRANHGKLRPSGLGSGSDEFPLCYEDKGFTCRDCQKQEVWTARQQQWWYEVAGQPLYMVAVRCKGCRGVKRTKDGQAASLDHEHRVTRAQERVAALSTTLGADQPKAVALLQAPLSRLRLKGRVEEALIRAGIETVGALVAHPGETRIPGLYQPDWRVLKRKLALLGFSVVTPGTPD